MIHFSFAIEAAFSYHFDYVLSISYSKKKEIFAIEAIELPILILFHVMIDMCL